MKWEKWGAVSTAIGMLFSLLNNSSIYAINQTEIESSQQTTIATEQQPANFGTCGDSLTWSIDDEGTLTITGSGKMDTFPGYAPWVNARNPGSIKKVILPDGLTSIGSYAFQALSGITDITIPNSVTTIGDFAFNSCVYLSSVQLSQNLTTIGSYAFLACNSLETITIPNSVTVINNNTFCNCNRLREVTLGNGVRQIGAEAFRATSLSTLYIPGNVLEIGTQAFAGCYLEDVKLENGLQSIGKQAFAGNRELIEIEFPKSVSIISEDAFIGCTSLSKATIQNPNCRIYNSEYTIHSLKLLGSSGSTAEKYAKDYGIAFESFEPSSPENPIIPDDDSDNPFEPFEPSSPENPIIPDDDSDNPFESFEPIRNGASFPHSNKALEDGFYDVKDYIFPYMNYGMLLTMNDSTKYDRLITIQNTKWGGSCFGIAVTIALDFNQKLNIENLSRSNNAAGYFDMEKPWTNKDFLNTIQYFQVAQAFEDFLAKGEISYCISETYKKHFKSVKDTGSIEDVLEELVENTSHTKNLYCLSYSYIHDKRSFGGHTINVFDSSFNGKTGFYEVKFYDMNSVDYDKKEKKYKYKEEPGTIYVSKNYKTFYFTDANGNPIGNTPNYDYVRISFINPDEFTPFPNNAAKNVAQKSYRSSNLSMDPNGNNRPTATFEFSVNTSFKLSNSKNEEIVYGPDGMECSMDIINSTVLGLDPVPRISLTVDRDTEYSLTTSDSNTSFTIYDNSTFMSIEDATISSARFDFEDNTIEMNGNGSAIAYISATDPNTPNNLIRFSSDFENNIILSSNDEEVSISSKNDLKKTTIKSFVPNKEYRYALMEDTASTIQYENGQLSSAQLYEVGDINADKIRSISDVVLLSRIIVEEDDFVATQFRCSIADINEDDMIDIQDIMSLIRIISDNISE